jgi:hypothetical protein
MWVANATPVTLSYVDFEDSAGTGTYNVGNAGFGSIAFVNWGGDFGGPAYEYDPQGLIDWLPPQATTLASFEAVNGPERVTVKWETLGEVDVELFLLESGAGPSGPWSPLAEFAPAGPSAYAFVHEPLPPEAPVWYRLSQRLTHGVVKELAVDEATPYSAALPDVILTVGPGGQFATIQAALAAATKSRNALLVEPGIYPSFTIDAPVGTIHVFPEGSGPVIVDTTSGPVLIRNVGFPGAVELSGLVVGDSSGASAGLVVEDCQGAVILDGLGVHGGVGLPGVQVARSTAVVLQGCAVDGSPGLHATDTSIVYASSGTLDEFEVATSSTAKLCQLPTSWSADPTSNVIEFAGVMPDLALPADLQPIGVPFLASVVAAPNLIWGLGVSTTYLPLDLDDPVFWQMLLLMDSTLWLDLASGVTDAATGAASASLVIPPLGVHLGKQLVFQAWTIELVPTVQVRFSNVETVFAVP